MVKRIPIVLHLKVTVFWSFTPRDDKLLSAAISSFTNLWDLYFYNLIIIMSIKFDKIKLWVKIILLEKY